MIKIVAYATVQYSKTCITHNANSESTESLEHPFLSSSTDVCHQNNMLGLQNWHLML